MSLTNPKDVVTEERLNEYHQTILPYLGGMPDILANKFSRADLYSTDEKMIGRWTDGKPLYQKVIDNISFSSSQILIPFSNEYTVREIRGFVYNANGRIPIGYGIDTNDTVSVYQDSTGLQFQNGFYSTYSSGEIIVQYTKTTDSPVEIGLDTDYSTDEKIIGTWIDGKPVYQRTFVKSSDFSADFYLADLSDSNIDTIIKGEGWWTRLGEGVVTQYPFGRTETPAYPNYDANIRYAGDVKKLRVLITNYPIYEITSMRYTIQYTKTTD